MTAPHLTETTTETAGGPRHHEANALAAGGGGPGRFALICYRETGKLSIEVTYWPTREQARQASAELVPCGLHCAGVHTVVDRDPPLRRPPAVLGLPRSVAVAKPARRSANHPR